MSKRETLFHLDNVFSNLNNVFCSLNDVFSNINQEFINESNILKELKSLYIKIKNKKEVLRIKIYKEIFYMKDFDIKIDADEYIKYMLIFEDDIEKEYKELKRNQDLIKDENKNAEFKKLIDDYYNANKLTKEIRIYLNTIS